MPDTSLIMEIMQGLAYIFVFFVGTILLVLVIIFIIDKSQTKEAIRHNYPVIGRFRYWFENLGVFFRQYFFAMDREELPFNRADRLWIYRACKDINNTTAFGSTRELRVPGTILFSNCPYPTLGVDAAEVGEVTIGISCKQPYKTKSLFNISGMSYGAISKPAVLALSNGARMAGCWMNTGEGGLSPFHLEGGADIVFQIGTAKFGVRDEQGKLSAEKLQDIAKLKQVKMFEIKLSQGAKPGKGGILPGEKVTAEISKIRGIKIGEDSISPNRHVEINNEDNLLDMINFVRDTTGKPTGIKVVIGAYGWVDSLCKAIKKRGIESAPDFITIDSADGGTGAAPMSLIDYMGLPLRESLPLVIDILKEHNLKDRVKIIASGKMVTPADVAWALCTGADFITSARGFMFSLGCIQALQCNKNTCPTGITTHNKKLQSGLNAKLKAVRVKNYVTNMVKEVGVIAHSCGVNEPRKLQRFHARMVTENGMSLPLDQIYDLTKVHELVSGSSK
ncbi:MAG: FMN-binding glutamate synthase family protein [Thiohalomonadales bacterium]